MDLLLHPAPALWEQWGHLRQQEGLLQDWERQGEEHPHVCRNQKQEQWELEKEPKVSMKSHGDGWCWFLDVREGTSPDPRAAGAREDQPSDLPPAEGLQTHSCRNKQFLKLRISWTQSVEMGWDGPHTPDQA